MLFSLSGPIPTFSFNPSLRRPFRFFSPVSGIGVLPLCPLVHRRYGYLGTIHIFRGRFLWCHTTILSILISLPYKTKRLYGQIAQNPADCGTSRKKIRSRNQNLYPGGSAEKIPTAIFRKICFIPYNFSRLSIFPVFRFFPPFDFSRLFDFPTFFLFPTCPPTGAIFYSLPHFGIKTASSLHLHFSRRRIIL